MADHDLDELLSNLRKLLAEQPTSSAAIDIELDLLGERLLDVMHRADRAELVEAWRRLRDLFDSTAAGLDDDCEDDPRFHLGRLAALVGLASAAVHRTPAAELQAAVDHDRLRALLVALRRGSSTSSRALGEATGSSEDTVCKDLGRLDRLGLVDSRKAGRRRITHLTLLGEELLAGWEARQAATRPAAQGSKGLAAGEGVRSAGGRALARPPARAPGGAVGLPSPHQPQWNPAAMAKVGGLS